MSGNEIVMLALGFIGQILATVSVVSTMIGRRLSRMEEAFSEKDKSIERLFDEKLLAIKNLYDIDLGSTTKNLQDANFELGRRISEQSKNISLYEKKDDLDRQIERCIAFCSSNGWTVELAVKEIASGMNDNRLNVKLDALGGRIPHTFSHKRKDDPEES